MATVSVYCLWIALEERKSAPQAKRFFWRLFQFIL